MAITRPFAFNTGSTITGTIQVGNLAIGVDAYDYSEQPGGVRWWNGPDESLGYVIAHETLAGNQPNPLDIPAFLGFWRTEGLDESLFISLSEWVSEKDGDPQAFLTGDDAKLWLNNNGYWTSFGESPAPTTTTTTTTEAPTTTTTTTEAPTGPFSVQFYESGSDVILSFAGQLDLTGLDYVQEFSVNGGGVNVLEGVFGIGPLEVLDVSLYTGATFTYPSNFGPGGGGPSGPSEGTGNNFGVFNGILPEQTIAVPTGYVSGEYIEGTTTLSGVTLSSLGMTEGTYNYSWGLGEGQSFELIIGGVSPTTTTTTTTTGVTTGNYLLIGAYEPADNNGEITFPNHNGGAFSLNPNLVGQAGYAIYINRLDLLGNDMFSILSKLIGNSGLLTLKQGVNSVTYSFTNDAFSTGSPVGQYYWDNVYESSPLGGITVVSPSIGDFDTTNPITITIEI
jgi:hypothetical protein